MYRRRTGSIARRTLARLAVIALVAATLTTLAPQATAPAAADGNEAVGAPLAARSITVGLAHTCAILPSGAVKCWGYGGKGQLGKDSTDSLGYLAGQMAALLPVDLGAGRTATAVTAGQEHTCVLLDNGTVKCWGQNSEGQLGQGSTANLGDGAGEMAALPAVNLGAGRTATAVAAGRHHSCALLDNGTVKCWGFNSSGQLGQDSTDSLGDQPGEMAALLPVNLGAGRTATAVTAGLGHTCALLDNGTVKCWGNGAYGQLGQGSLLHLGDGAGEMAALLAVNLGAGRTATAVTAGGNHSCALLDNGTVKCWGAGHSGQLGKDSTDSLGYLAGQMAALLPVNLGAGRTATAVTAGDTHTCALLDNGTVKCWGNGVYGRLGQDSTDSLGDGAGEMAALLAVNLGAGRTATAVTAGETHSCALLDNGAVKCWGRGSSGQLGQDSTATLGDQAGEMAALAPVNLGPASMTVAMTADETTVVAGGTIHYHGTVTNTGVQALSEFSIELSSPFPITCGLESHPLAAGGHRAIDCEVYTTSGAEVGTHAFMFTLGTTQTGPVDSNIVNVTVTAAPAPSLTVHQTVDETAVVEGDTVHLHVKVTNTGNVALTNVAIVDTNAASCAVAPFGLAVGADRTVDCTHAAVVGDVPTYHNTASVTATEVTTPVVSNTVDVAVAAAAAGFSVVKSADEASVSPGQPIHYHLVVTNTGNVALHGVDVVDAPAPDCGDDAVFDLEVGAFTTIDCAYVASGNDVGVYSNTAGVTSDEIGTAVQSNTVEVTVDPAVTVDKTADETSVVAGEAIHYHLHITNTSAVARSGLAVTDANAPGCDGTVADLAPAADVTVDCSYTTTTGDVGTYSNTATVDSADIAAVESNTVDVAVAAAAAPGLSVVKSADETSVVVRDRVHLHVKVTNTGNVALTNVTIVDANAASCEVAPFSLAVGADRTVDCTHKAIAAEVAGGYHNTASVTSTEVTTPVVSNTVDVTVTIPAGAGLVSGTVTETGSGTPVAGAVVAVLSTATFATVAVATANASGAYVAAPPAGTYFVYAIDPSQAHTAGFSGAPTAVAVTAGNTVTANAALASTRGTLAGTVTDTGGPLAGVLAMSINTATGQLTAGDVTDNTGAYSIPGLAPGPRLLAFIDLSVTHPLEYYDDSLTSAGSSLLTIAAAGTTTADAALATQAGPGTGAHLTGQVTSTTGANLEGVAVLALRTSDFGLAAADLTDGTGNYDIALDPGTYKLAFYDPSGTHLFEWHDNQPTSGLGSATTVTATAGTPLATNAVLTPTTGVVSGTVTETGTNTNLANVFVIAINTNGVVVGATTTAANGTYTLTGLPVGNIRISFIDLDGAHTDEYYDNSPDYAGGALVPITAGSATPNTNAALTPTL